MNRIELAARNILRRSGLSGLIVKALRLPAEARKRRLRDLYEKERPLDAMVRIGEFEAKLTVTNADEFAHYVWSPEQHILRQVLRNINPGDIVWDVGANVGMHTLLIAKAVGPRGLVIAFEPMKACFDRLSENIQRNDLQNVTALQLALGRERDEMQLAAEPQSSGLEGDHRLARYIVGESGRSMERVQVIPGDELRAERRLNVPNWIKLDVQGAEEDVLRGLDSTVRESACRGVFLEVHYSILAETGQADAPMRIENHLSECGFKRITRLDRNHLGAFK